MAFNNCFPVTYPQLYPQYPAYQQMLPVQSQTPAQTQPIPQMMTPPTIRAEIVQVDGEQAAKDYPVGAGASQMMIAKDDSAIYVKTATPNGQATLDVFVKRPPAPPAPAFDPASYVTKDELEARISSILALQGGEKPKKGADKE